MNKVMLMDALSHEVYMTRTAALAEYKDLLSVKDLSAIFGVSAQTIYKEIRNGKFGDPIRIGRTYKIPKIHILERFFYYA